MWNRCGTTGSDSWSSAASRRLWACAESGGVLRKDQQAAAPTMAYRHVSQHLSMEGTVSGSRSATAGETVAAGPASDPTNGPVPTQRMFRYPAGCGQASRARAVHAYIEDHLHDPDLGVDQLCRRFAMSRRTLYRMFADHGGVARYLTERRLARAFDALKAASPTRGLIKAVALTYGFVDQDYFGRLFRKRFAIVPSEAVGLGSGGHDRPPEGSGSQHGNAQEPRTTDRTSRSDQGEEGPV